MSWDQEIRDDVIEECSKHGGVLHIFVDKASPQGNVYVKCPTIAAAVASVNSLHGRYFGGRGCCIYFGLVDLIMNTTVFALIIVDSIIIFFMMGIKLGHW